jgi:hypothetical protein
VVCTYNAHPTGIAVTFCVAGGAMTHWTGIGFGVAGLPHCSDYDGQGDKGGGSTTAEAKPVTWLGQLNGTIESLMLIMTHVSVPCTSE